VVRADRILRESWGRNVFGRSKFLGNVPPVPELPPSLALGLARIASSFDSAVPGPHQDWCSRPLTGPLVTHLLMMLRKRVRLIW